MGGPIVGVGVLSGRFGRGGVACQIEGHSGRALMKGRVEVDVAGLRMLKCSSSLSMGKLLARVQAFLM